MKKPIPFEYKITILYILFGALWILFSDKLLASFTTDPVQIQKISIFKGWFYVLITGILLYLLVKEEIRRRNNLFNELSEARKKAVESDHLKTAFLMNLNHYIRTPMNSILGFVGLLENKNLDAEKQKLFLTYINDRSHKLLYTLNSIIDVAQLQEGQVEQVKTLFGLNDLINQIVEQTHTEINRTNKPISVKHSFGLPNGDDEILADRSKLLQILEHLITNAVFYTHHGEISIGYSCVDRTIFFYVADTGQGIPAEKQKNLFNHFMANPYQVAEPNEGVGLGLFLANRYATLLGGKLWLHRSDNSGSEFRLSIPR